MWWLVELLLEIAVGWCSWRLWLCIGIAIAIMAGLHHRYPGQSCMWYVSIPVACGVIAFGAFWQILADRS